MTWICSQCGLMNDKSECHGCGASRPDYGRHVQILNLGKGPVFNGPVNVAVMPAEEALAEFYGEEILDVLERPTSWEQFTDFCIKLMFWGSMCVIGLMCVIFALIVLVAIFGPGL